jgi:hypothetical protein
MYDKILSLGGTCTPTWQIRKFTGEEILYPLDWITTPFESLFPLIENNFAELGDPRHFESAVGGKSARNRKYDTLHNHDFRKIDGDLLAPDWETTLPLLQRKYEVMIDRWTDAVSQSKSILFVRHQGHFDVQEWRCDRDLGGNDAERLCLALERQYPRLAFDVLFVTAAVPTGIHPRAIGESVGWGENDWENPDDRWRGATGEWQKLFHSVMAREPTPAKVAA